MKNLIRTALVTLALPFLFASPAMATQIPYNRGIRNVEVRPSQQHGEGFYDLTVDLEFNMGPEAPYDSNLDLDLSARLEVFVNGVFWTGMPLQVRASNGDNDYPTCDNFQPCDGDCGITEVGADWYSNHCVPPYINGGTGPCMCTSYAASEVQDIFVDPTTPGDITVQIAVAGNQLAEIYTDDDIYSFPFIGASYCIANPNSTGEPARIEALGSRSVQTNDFTLVASPLPVSQFGIFFYSAMPIQAPFGEGFRCVGGQTIRLPVASTGSEGILSMQLDFTQPTEPGGVITAGDTRYFQTWYRDPQGGPSGFNLSDGYMVTFLP